MTRAIILENPVPGKRLGRHIYLGTPAPEHREGATDIVSVYHASSPNMPLNQGDIGSCTAEALVGALNTIPHWKLGNPTLGQPDAQNVYRVETAMENAPWPPNDPGGTGHEVCQAGVEMGLLDGFQSATGIDAALRALVIRPVITGVNWYDSFDNCDPTTGIVSITPGAKVRGGHEVVATQIDATNELVWFWQSWGLGYGLNGTGRFAVSFSTWATLLGQGGDVTVPRTAHGWKA